jgi:hypothetical protein
MVSQEDLVSISPVSWWEALVQSWFIRILVGKGARFMVGWTAMALMSNQHLQATLLGAGDHWDQ